MFRALILLVLVAPLLPAQTDSAAAARLRHYLDAVVADGRAAGTVALVLQGGEPVFQYASGLADREAGVPMAMSTLFRIASQSKALTSVAAMMLVEDGTFGLGDPISRWLPAFANATVSESYDSAGSPRRRVVPVRQAITIGDLLTHTAGMSYGREAHLQAAYAARGLGPEAGAGWYFTHKTTDICTAIAPLAELPLAAQPGERFVYGYATDVLGCLIERASGMSLAEFIRTRITEPLEMHDTGFCVDPADRDRMAAVYGLVDGALTRSPDGPLGQGDYVGGPCRAFGGGAGLVSTAPDYARFLEMLLLGGTIDGVRILSPASVALMTRDHIDALYLGPEWGFGLGFAILLDPGKAAEYGEAGRWGWGGAYHTVYWVDPAYDMVAVLMTQLMPATGSTLQSRYRALVYQLLN